VPGYTSFLTGNKHKPAHTLASPLGTPTTPLSRKLCRWSTALAALRLFRHKMHMLPKIMWQMSMWRDSFKRCGRFA